MMLMTSTTSSMIMQTRVQFYPYVSEFVTPDKMKWLELT